MSQNDAQSETPPLKIDQLKKSFGSVQALKGVSLEVKTGEVFALLGPNGAGKTTMISIVTTLERASSGRVKIFGHDIETETRSAKQRVGVVPQEVINHGYFNAEEILQFHAGYYGVRDAGERIAQLLRDLDLWDHRHKKVRQLSGGMKRRLMIAKALVHNPGLLLLDEPTAGVDVELRLKLWDYIERLKSEGLSILLTTHYLEEAERLCDRVAIIDRGELKALDQTTKLIAQWTRKRVKVKVASDRISISHPQLLEHSGQEWTFLTEMEKTLGQLLVELKLATADIVDVKVEEGKLEDVFVHFTRKESPA